MYFLDIVLKCFSFVSCLFYLQMTVSERYYVRIARWWEVVAANGLIAICHSNLLVLFYGIWTLNMVHGGSIQRWVVSNIVVWDWLMELWISHHGHASGMPADTPSCPDRSIDNTLKGTPYFLCDALIPVGCLIQSFFTLSDASCSFLSRLRWDFPNSATIDQTYAKRSHQWRCKATNNPTIC